jgi:hypothetical protein
MAMTFKLDQAGKPHGIVGRVVRWIMSRYNRPDNEWTVALLETSTRDTIPEVGFGSGQAVKLDRREMKTAG